MCPGEPTKISGASAGVRKLEAPPGLWEAPPGLWSAPPGLSRAFGLQDSGLVDAPPGLEQQHLGFFTVAAAAAMPFEWSGVHQYSPFALGCDVHGYAAHLLRNDLGKTLRSLPEPVRLSPCSLSVPSIAAEKHGPRGLDVTAKLQAAPETPQASGNVEDNSLVSCLHDLSVLKVRNSKDKLYIWNLNFSSGEFTDFKCILRGCDGGLCRKQRRGNSALKVCQGLCDISIKNSNDKYSQASFDVTVRVEKWEGDKSQGAVLESTTVRCDFSEQVECTLVQGEKLWEVREVPAEAKSSGCGGELKLRVFIQMKMVQSDDASHSAKAETDSDLESVASNDLLAQPIASV